MHNILHYLDKDGIDAFQVKFDSISDRKVRAKILHQIELASFEESLERYVSKDIAGVSELLVTVEPGYRIFFRVIGNDIILLFLTIGKKIKRDYITISEYRDGCMEGERTWLKND